MKIALWNFQLFSRTAAVFWKTLRALLAHKWEKSIPTVRSIYGYKFDRDNNHQHLRSFNLNSDFRITGEFSALSRSFQYTKLQRQARESSPIELISIIEGLYFLKAHLITEYEYGKLTSDVITKLV